MSPVLALLVASSLTAAPDPKQVEADQLARLEGQDQICHLAGTVLLDTAEHQVQLETVVRWSAAPRLALVSGTWDGLPEDPAGLRSRWKGAQSGPPVDMSLALAPFHSADLELQGEEHQGAERVFHFGSADTRIASVEVHVDAQTGAKRSVVVQLGGAARLAQEANIVLDYEPSGRVRGITADVDVALPFFRRHLEVAGSTS